MTARPGLFVQVFDAGLGRDKGITQPQDARLALSSLLQEPTEPGIVYDPSGGNLAVTGTADSPNIRYKVADGTAATLRSTGDGLQLWYNDEFVPCDTLTPAPGSGSRYDLIWAWGKDGSAAGSDPDSDPEFGVTVGASAASNPVKPYSAVPDGALVLAEALVEAGDASGSATVITPVAPFKVAPGAPTPVRTKGERDALAKWVGRKVIRLDVGSDANNAASKGREERWDGSGWFTFRFGQTTVNTLAHGDFSIDATTTGLTVIKTATLENGSGALEPGARQNITIAKNVPYTSVPAGTLTGRVYVAEDHTELINTTVPVLWKAWGYQ